MAVNGIDEAAFEQQQWSNPNVSDTCKGWCIFCWIDNCYNQKYGGRNEKHCGFFPLLPMLDDDDNIDANIPQVALEHHDASSDEQ